MSSTPMKLDGCVTKVCCMAEQINTIVVGGGQAGLAISYELTQQGQPHIVLEQAAQAGAAWRRRWDSFTLVTPNWATNLPGAGYLGDDPDGFMPRAAIVAYLEQYVERFKLPVHYGVRVMAVERKPGGSYLVSTDQQAFEATNVVIATGLFQRPRLPPLSAELPANVAQLHSDEYRNPQALAPGAVLVVGSAQSGCQIAEELNESGRTVYLCVGGAGRLPRRYRGKDSFWWAAQSGFLDRTVDQLPSPRAKFVGNPHVSGKHGGHTLNLHQFARNGITLLGHIQAVHDGTIALAPDLKASLALADNVEADFVNLVDTYIERHSLDAPADQLPALRDAYGALEMRELNVQRAGIGTVIWATGYAFDFSLVKLPIVDTDGYPIQRRGVTAYPGLYFLGLPWLHKMKSGLLFGVGEDAAFLAAQIAARG